MFGLGKGVGRPQLRVRYDEDRTNSQGMRLVVNTLPFEETESGRKEMLRKWNTARIASSAQDKSLVSVDCDDDSGVACSQPI